MVFLIRSVESLRLSLHTVMFTTVKVIPACVGLELAKNTIETPPQLSFHRSL